MNEDIDTAKFRVSGHVQGVGFRAWTRSQAASLGISDWVRNEPDGSVSGLVSGAPAAVRRMIALLHEGPRGARVSQVATEEGAPPSYAGFEIRSRRV